MRFVRQLLIVGVAAAVLAACGGSSGSKTTTSTALSSKNLVVTTTTTQIADFVTIIGGSHVKVTSILKPGVDPHDYKLTAADINAISSSDVVFQNGLGLEPWFDSSIGNIDHKGPVVNVSDSVTTTASSDPNSHGVDPHIWMSVVNAKTMVANVQKALSAADPADKEEFVITERGYDAQLDALVNQASKAIGSLTNKTFVTDHNSFQYFCDEFGLTCAATLIPTSGKPAPTDTQITSVATSLTGTNTKAVFAQTNVPAEYSEKLASQLGVKVLKGNDALYADTLGQAGGDADTYIKAQTHNLSVIVNNLRN